MIMMRGAFFEVEYVGFHDLGILGSFDYNGIRF